MATKAALAEQWLLEKMASSVFKQGERLSIYRLRQQREVKLPYQDWRKAILRLRAQHYVERVDRRYFTGSAPQNVRSKEQIHLLLLLAVASKMLTAYTWEQVAAAIQQIFAVSRSECTGFKNYLRDVKALEAHLNFKDESCVTEKAREALKRFTFTFEPFDQVADRLFAEIANAPTVGSVCVLFNNLRVAHGNSGINRMFFAQELLAAEGLTVAKNRRVHLSQGASLLEYKQVALAQRAWLRRRHCTEASDLEALHTCLSASARS